MTIKRLQIYKNLNNQKYFSLDTHSNVEGYKLLTLNDDLSSLQEITDIQNIRKNEVDLLEIKLEVSLTEERIGNGMLKAAYQFIRIIRPGDLDIDKWLSTESLEDLPVAPYLEVNAEELIWAGKSSGNLKGRVMLYGFISVLLLYVGFNRDPITLSLVSLAILITLYVIKTTKWNPPTKESKAKISELKKHKQNLIDNIQDRIRI